VGLGNLTTLSGGTINVGSSGVGRFFVDFNDAIAGNGTINSANVQASYSVINGTVQGTSALQPITLSGWIKGDGTFNNVTFIGTHDPGFSPTLLNVGNVTYASTASLDMELGGTTRGTQYDAIVSTGNLKFGGSLLVSLLNGFAPAVGNSFDLFDWSTLSGTFANIQLPKLAGGLTWNTSQLYTTGTLSVGGVPGDYNHDGTVDAADYTIWRDTLGSTTDLRADGNGNGVIDQADFGVWA
jgi:hypothetical protein